jgi:hypothetical protein
MAIDALQAVDIIEQQETWASAITYIIVSADCK